MREKARWQPWDLMVLFMKNWPWTGCTDTEEMRAVQYIEIPPCVPLFSHQAQGRGFVKTSLCALSHMSSTRVLLEDSSRCETDGSSICLDKRWETIGLSVKDRNPSRVSVTLFSNDVLELGQHWEKIVVSWCCVPLTYIRAVLKVRAAEKAYPFLTLVGCATCTVAIVSKRWAQLFAHS